MDKRRAEFLERYLSNKQVYFRKELCDADFKTIAEGGRVHDVGRFELTRINNETVAMGIEVNGRETTVYLNMTNSEVYDWMMDYFIPLSELVYYWQNRDFLTDKEWKNERAKEK